MIIVILETIFGLTPIVLFVAYLVRLINEFFEN